MCCCREALSQTSDKCHLSGGFGTWAGVKGREWKKGEEGGGEKTGVHTSLMVGDGPVTNLLIHTQYVTHTYTQCA